MESKIIDVVGVMFFKDGRILIDKPRKRPTYQMVGGRVEEGETPLQGAIRECREELGNKAIFDTDKIEPVMDFIETATSDPNLKIHMYVFKYNGLLEGEINTSEEIESFMWFGRKDNQDILSNTLKNEIIPWATKEGYLK